MSTHGAAAGDHGDATGLGMGPRQHVHLDLGAEVRAQGVRQTVHGQTALPDDRGAARDPLADREVLLELAQPDPFRAETRRRDLGVHVERRMGVVETDPALAHGLEGLLGERQKPRLVGEVQRVLGEDERRRWERLDDAVAREDTRHHALDVLGAVRHQPVPTPLPADRDVLPPVGLGIDLLEGPRPVVVANVLDAEVAVELCDELCELHRSDAKAGPSRCRVVKTPSNRSPCWSIRPSATSIENSRGSSPSFTSSQRSGVDTGAPGCGRTE